MRRVARLCVKKAVDSGVSTLPRRVTTRHPRRLERGNRRNKTPELGILDHVDAALWHMGYFCRRDCYASRAASAHTTTKIWPPNLVFLFSSIAFCEDFDMNATKFVLGARFSHHQLFYRNKFWPQQLPKYRTKSVMLGLFEPRVLGNQLFKTTIFIVVAASAVLKESYSSLNAEANGRYRGHWVVQLLIWVLGYIFG